jgi:hypothetical protein
MKAENFQKRRARMILLIIVLVIGLAGMIGNQYSMLRKMEGIEAILREIRDKK